MSTSTLAYLAVTLSAIFACYQAYRFASRLIYLALRSILRLNACLYGSGSSHELCRDLAPRFGKRVI